MRQTPVDAPLPRACHARCFANSEQASREDQRCQCKLDEDLYFVFTPFSELPSQDKKKALSTREVSIWCAIAKLTCGNIWLQQVKLYFTLPGHCAFKPSPPRFTCTCLTHSCASTRHLSCVCLPSLCLYQALPLLELVSSVSLPGTSLSQAC